MIHVPAFTGVRVDPFGPVQEAREELELEKMIGLSDSPPMQ